MEIDKSKQLLISFANWVTENDIKNLRPQQLAEFYLEEHAKQSKQEEVDHVKDFHTWRLPNEKPQEKVDEAMTKEIFDLATKIRKGKWTRAEIASEVELLFRRNTLQDNELRMAAEKVSALYKQGLSIKNAMFELEKAVNQNKDE